MSQRLVVTAAVGLLVALVLTLLAAPWASANDPRRVSSTQPPVGNGIGGVSLRSVGNFNLPTYVDHAPGFPHLLFVVELSGTVRVLRDGTELAHPFLDLRDRVRTNQPWSDDGMSTIAFAPDYQQSGRFYVFYVNKNGNIEIDEFTRSSQSPTIADPNSRRAVIVINHPYSGSHNGGQLQFGPDGHLYLSTGDGTVSGDSQDLARNLWSLLGKLLRIDPQPGGGYTIPSGNPLVGKPGKDAIFSWGFRNPWRFSFDKWTGRIAIADVGQDKWEEVDYETPAGAKGANFGWPQYEGNELVDPSRPGPGPPVFPIFAYPHSPTGVNAVIGGYVVRNEALTTLYGRYLYTDFGTGELRSFVPNLDGASDDRALGPTVSSPVSFGQGTAGRIYVATYDGPVYQLVPH